MATPCGTRSGSESDPENRLRSCAVLLGQRDFAGCRKLARRVPRSDPNISVQVDQILAIADVLTAAEPSRGNSHRDWYSILQLRRSDATNRDLARQQFKTLVRLLDPNKNKFPFADDALMRVREAWIVISDAARGARFDRETGENNIAGEDVANENGVNRGATSFWTLCPYCWYLHEYEMKYRDCSFRCGNCRRTFHGVAVKPPAPEMMVEGKEQYYCYEVSLPLRYPMAKRRRFDFDGDVGDSSERVVEGNGGAGFQGNAKKRMRIKTVANRVRMKGFIEANSDSDMDADEGGVL